MSEYTLEFRKLKIKSDQISLFNVYYVIENGRSQVIDGFNKMPKEKQGEVINLINKMATIEDLQSDKIRWRMKKKYSFGELKPKGHRFFFFLKFGNNIVFFRYSTKKSDTLGDKFYQYMEDLKRRYESEFEKGI